MKNRFLRGITFATGLTVVASLVSCSGGSPADPNGQAPVETDIQFAIDALEAGYEGSWTAPPTAGPDGEAGKNIWYISCGELAIGCSVPAAAAGDAAKALGWDFTLYDGFFNVENKYTTGIEQAIVSGADGIIVGGVDCSLVSPALERARAAGIPVIPFQAWDCDDPSVGGEALFAESPEISADAPTWTDFAYGLGAMAANWVIADSEGTAKVIEFTLHGKLLGDYISRGFVEQMERCGSCEVVQVVEALSTDLTSEVLAEKASAALVAHPDATYIHTPLDTFLSQGVGGALERSGRADSVHVIASEGYADNLDLIRGGGVQSASVYYSLEWIAWGLVDTLNRHFAGEREFPAIGAGLMVIDADHNLPDEPGTRPQPVDYRSAYLSIWGK